MAGRGGYSNRGGRGRGKGINDFYLFIFYFLLDIKLYKLK